MTTYTNISRPVFWVMGSLTILVSGLLTFIYLTEWYTISILDKAEGYPFGSEGPTPYYYKTADLYSTVNLIWGVLFLTILAFGIWTLIKRRKKGMLVIFGLTVLSFTAMFVHGQIVTN